jgi:glycosyltransferase involved in cell wall biosynthesis
MKKIAILADFPLHEIPGADYPAPKGHYATWLPQLARAFQDQKEYEIHWVCLSDSSKDSKTLYRMGQYFHILPTTKRGRALTLFWKDRKNIQKKINEISPVLVHGWGNENIWAWASAFSGLPNIVSVQGIMGTVKDFPDTPWRTKAMSVVEWISLKKAQVIVTESEWARDQVNKMTSRNDVRVIEYGVNEEFFAASHSPNPEKPYALFVGTAGYGKGIDKVVDIFCNKSMQNINLKICGGVTPFGEIQKRRCHKNVMWMGRLARGEVINLMANSSFLILPTRADTGPMVIKEARVLGIPVLASPHGGHVHYIIEGKTGFICELDKINKWVEKARYLMRNPGIAKKMGKNLQVKHREELKVEKTAQRFINLYSEVIANPKAKRH